MIRLTETLSALQTAELASVLKRELEQLDAAFLPLQQGLARGSQVADEGFSVMVIGVTEEPSIIRAKVGVFYSGIIAGCSCADDPTPVDTHPEYCELQVEIDKATAETRLTLLPP